MLKTKRRKGLQSAKKKQIMLLETKLDNLEHLSRKFNFEICGIPEDEDEDLEDTIINYRNT